MIGVLFRIGVLKVVRDETGGYYYDIKSDFTKYH